MAICNAYYRTQTLYRGQTARFQAILSSGWRDLWLERSELARELYTAAATFVMGKTDSRKLEKELTSIGSRSKKQPSLYTFMFEPAGREAVVSLLTHIRKSIGPGPRRSVALYELEMLERSFFMRYQAYLFNNIPDPFVSRFVRNTLKELASVLFAFYDTRQESFDTEFRITQVGLDFMGVLQHYGVLGTPGLDLTDDLDVALWFATHDRTKGYQQMPTKEWGVVYEVRAPVVTFSPTPIPDEVLIDELPAGVALNLATISPLFTRITRQHGWYAIHGLAWESMFDYGGFFDIKHKHVTEYGSQREIERRFQSKGLSADYLFPSPAEDPFRRHLEQAGIVA